MYKGKPGSLFAKYAVPQMVGLLFNSVYLIVDGLFIGNRLGRQAMAAAAVAVPFIEILIAVSMAVASGAGILISTHLGSGKRQEANGAFNRAVRVLGGISVFIVVLGNVFIGSLATLLGATREIHAEAVAYLWYIVSFSPFLLFSFLLGGLVRNDGRPRLAMFALAFGSVSNILLDYVFLYPLDMGIAGAALATALGPIFSVLILLPHFLLKRGRLHFARCDREGRETGRIFVLGFPSFIMEFTIGIITFAYNSAIIRQGYGEMGLAAYLVLGYIMLIFLTIFLGFAEGLQPVFSYFAGAGEVERSRALLRFSTGVFFGAGLLLYLLIAFFARDFVTLFAPGDPALVDFANRQSLYYFIGFPLAGYNILMISYWQCAGQARRALPVSLLRSVVLPPLLLLLLPLWFGSGVIWLCHSFSEALTAAAVLLLPQVPGTAGKAGQMASRRV